MLNLMPLSREGEPGGRLSTDAERMVSALRYANYSRVAEELGVTRSAVARWAKGRQVTPWNLSRVEALLGHTKEADPPEWAGRLMRTVDAIAYKVGVSQDEERAPIDAAVAALLPLPADGTEEDPLEDGLAGAGRPDRPR